MSQMFQSRFAGWRAIGAATAAALALVATPALAQGVLIDKSDIRFVSKQMGVNIEGRFRKWSANVVFLPADLAKSKADLEVQLASIDLASAESESEAEGAVWFDTAKFPVARFSSTSFRDAGGGKYDVTGRLTIKGATRDVVVPITFGKDAAGNRVAEGTFVVKRLDFKIGEGLWADTATVANEVVVRVRMTLASAG